MAATQTGDGLEIAVQFHDVVVSRFCVKTIDVLRDDPRKRWRNVSRHPISSRGNAQPLELTIREELMIVMVMMIVVVMVMMIRKALKGGKGDVSVVGERRSHDVKAMHTSPPISLAIVFVGHKLLVHHRSVWWPSRRAIVGDAAVCADACTRDDSDPARPLQEGDDQLC